VIDEVREDGQILEPFLFRVKFRNVIEALIRDKCNPSIPNWHAYPENLKEELWTNKLTVNFNFKILVEKLALVKRRAMR
jgi:hypothetical protein